MRDDGTIIASFKIHSNELSQGQKVLFMLKVTYVDVVFTKNSKTYGDS